MRILLAIAMVVCAAKTCLGSDTPCTVPKDEMQVITSYLKWSVDSMDATVLVMSTVVSDIDVDYVALRLGLAGHRVPVDVRSDLKHKNNSTCALRSISSVPNLRFISQREHDGIFHGRRGWSEFRKRYGKNASIVSVSRVGFNSDHTIAVFYSTGGIGPMAGSCYLYVFRLLDGKWVKDAESPVWNT